VAVINAHDPHADELAAAARKAGAEVRTYGIGQGDWRAESYSLTPAARCSNWKPRQARPKLFRGWPAR
jgi:UDP-N-acetylmuramyl tripeptide synthase